MIRLRAPRAGLQGRAGCRASQRSSCAANAWRSRACSAGGPPVATPAPRNSFRKPRTDRRSAMLSLLNGSPRGLTAAAPRSSTRAAKGMSWVTTRSPALTRSAIASSAASGPPGTCSARTWARVGVRRKWLATKGDRDAGALGGAEQNVANDRRAGVGVDPDLRKTWREWRIHLGNREGNGLTGGQNAPDSKTFVRRCRFLHKTRVLCTHCVCKGHRESWPGVARSHSIPLHRSALPTPATQSQRRFFGCCDLSI